MTEDGLLLTNEGAFRLTKEPIVFPNAFLSLLSNRAPLMIRNFYVDKRKPVRKLDLCLAGSTPFMWLWHLSELHLRTTFRVIRENRETFFVPTFSHSTVVDTITAHAIWTVPPEYELILGVSRKNYIFLQRGQQFFKPPIANVSEESSLCLGDAIVEESLTADSLAKGMFLKHPFKVLKAFENSTWGIDWFHNTWKVESAYQLFRFCTTPDQTGILHNHPGYPLSTEDIARLLQPVTNKEILFYSQEDHNVD